MSAQSWEGLAGTEDERHRVAATAEGGIWLLRTPRPDAVVALAGTQPSVDTTRRFAGAGAWSDDGLSRTRLAPVLDGDLVRRLDVGQVCYVYRGGVTFLQIKRLTGRQAAIGSGRRLDHCRRCGRWRPGSGGMDGRRRRFPGRRGRGRAGVAGRGGSRRRGQGGGMGGGLRRAERTADDAAARHRNAARRGRVVLGATRRPTVGSGTA